MRAAFPRLLALAASTVVLAACAQTAPPGTATDPSASVEPEPTPTVTWRSEAPVTLKTGAPTDLSGSRGLPKAVVTVDSITEDAPCATGAATPKNGQFVAVKVSAQRLDTSSNGFSMAVYDWGTVNPSGEVTPGTSGLVTGLCLTDGSALRLAWDASGRTTGTLLVDAPKDVAAVVATNTMVTPNVTVTVEMPAR